MSSLDRYTSSKVSDEACQGEKFAPDGFPYPCDDTRVFELCRTPTVASFTSVNITTECYWSFWPRFPMQSEICGQLSSVVRLSLKANCAGFGCTACGW